MENKHTDTQTSKTKSRLFLVLKVVLTLAAAGLIFLVGTLLGLLLAYQDIHLVMTYIVGYLLPALLLPLIWLKQRKKYLKLWLAAAALCFVVLGVHFGLVKYSKALEVDTSRYLYIHEDFPAYLPFDEDSKIVQYDSKTLKLQEDLPVIDGSVAFYPLFSAFVNAVYPETEDYYLGSFDNVQTWGYETMAEKETDIFIHLEHPTEAQKAHAASCGTTYEYTTIGTEALVFIVDKDNPVDSLTAEQIRGIYSGEITNWKEVGGKNQKIKAYQNEAGTANQNMMERFMGDTPLMETPTEMGYDELFGWEELICPYRNKPDAIGFAFRYCVKDNPDIKFLQVDGVAPTPENMENGSYPIVTPILAVTYEENTHENVDKMIDWMLSEEGQYVITQTGYAGVVSDYLN